MKNLINNLREKRIQRLLSSPENSILAKPGVKRLLVIVIVAGSWIYLLDFLPAKTPSRDFALLHYLVWFWLPPVVLACFALLRISVRRITSLPDEYLDEREISNRDWAYRMGYLVVRRIGLSVTLALAAFLVVIDVWRNPRLGYNYSGPDMESPANDVARMVSDFIKSYFAVDATYTMVCLMGLLTFVAYSFPVILLAWRESKHYEAPVIDNWRGVLIAKSNSYFVHLRRFGYSVIGMIVIWAVSPVWGMNLLFPVLIYGLFVYTWGIVTQYEQLRILKSAQATGMWRKLMGFTVAVTVFGVSIPLAFYAATIWYEIAGGLVIYALAAGVTMVMLHLASFSAVKSFAEKEN